jgi:tRNA A37 N6-isopentenylltransferase MiaA
VKGFEEHAVDRRRLAAAESLARATGVDYAVAYRHLANGTARVLIESRGRAPRAVVKAGRPRPEAGAARFVGQAGSFVDSGVAR